MYAEYIKRVEYVLFLTVISLWTTDNTWNPSVYLGWWLKWNDLIKIGVCQLLVAKVRESGYNRITWIFMYVKCTKRTECTFFLITINFKTTDSTWNPTVYLGWLLKWNDLMKIGKWKIC